MACPGELARGAPLPILIRITGRWTARQSFALPLCRVNVVRLQCGVVPGVVDAVQLPFQARHVGQVGQVLYVLEAAQEGLEMSAEAVQVSTIRRVGAAVFAGQRGEEFFAYQLRDDGIGGGQCLAPGRSQVAAVEGEAFGVFELQRCLGARREQGLENDCCCAANAASLLRGKCPLCFLPPRWIYAWGKREAMVAALLASPSKTPRAGCRCPIRSARVARRSG